MNMKKTVLWKYDGILGIAYFCPSCKVFVCGGSTTEDTCHACGENLDWNTKNQPEYSGKTKWD